MKILLVNPNRFHSPPVPPIGLEFTAAFLESKGHETVVLDLCFSENTKQDIDEAINLFRPQLAGISVRNIDTVLYQTNQFFLDEIREIVRHIREEHGLKIVLGGSGIATNPEAVMNYLGADYVVCGPAEDSIEGMLDAVTRAETSQRVFFSPGTGEITCRRKVNFEQYGAYSRAGGIAGFETHKGCSSSCVYCLEANTRVRFREISSVIRELTQFSQHDIREYHLCDSEFNEDIDYSLEFLNELKRAELRVKWAVYMKPGNFNHKMFRLMRETGVSLITLTVDSFNKCPQYWSDIEKMVFISKSSGIRLCIDFLTGFPWEEKGDLEGHLDFFRRLQPHKVNINTYIRLYKTLRITKLIVNDKNLGSFLLGNKDDSRFVRPVFFNRLSSAELKQLTGEDPLFRIEGEQQGVNYLRD